MFARAWDDRDVVDPEAAGCSGGLSWVYAIGGRDISCVECCNRHDIDYELGGAAADERLRDCAARMPGYPCWEGSGLDPRTWREAATGAARLFRAAAKHLAACLWWPVRRAWRWLRAWIMYGAVRTFGGGIGPGSDAGGGSAASWAGGKRAQRDDRPVHHTV